MLIRADLQSLTVPASVPDDDTAVGGTERQWRTNAPTVEDFIDRGRLIYGKSNETDSIPRPRIAYQNWRKLVTRPFTYVLIAAGTENAHANGTLKRANDAETHSLELLLNRFCTSAFIWIPAEPIVHVAMPVHAAA